MTNKKKANQSASRKTSRINDTSTAAQCDRLLEWLNQRPIDTITARRELNIMMPAARIKDLRNLGHDIRRHLVTLTDDQGRTHRGVALYYLSGQSTGRVAA